MKPMIYGIVSSTTGEILHMSSSKKNIDESEYLEGNFYFNIAEMFSIISLRDKLKEKGLEKSFYTVKAIQLNHTANEYNIDLNALTKKMELLNKVLNESLSQYEPYSDEYNLLIDIFKDKQSAIEKNIDSLRSRIKKITEKIQALRTLVA